MGEGEIRESNGLLVNGIMKNFYFFGYVIPAGYRKKKVYAAAVISFH